MPSASDRLLDLILMAGYDAAPHDDELSLVCPLCADHKPRLYINQRSGLWVCFNCSERGNLLSFLERVVGLDPFEAWHEYQRLRTDAPRTRSAPASDAPPPAVELPEGFLRLTDPNDQFQAPFWNYLARRGVSLPTVLAYRMGYTLIGRAAGRVVIPIYLDHEPRAWVARMIHSGVEPKVLTPAGAKMSHLLFNLDRVRDLGREEAILVEGVFDALALPDEAVATLGAKLSPTQRHLLRRAGLKRVYLMWDPDAAGRAGMARASGELAAAGFDVFVASLPPGVDPAEASSVDIRRALQNARPVVLESQRWSTKGGI
jgi:DNA primase